MTRPMSLHTRMSWGDEDRETAARHLSYRTPAVHPGVSLQAGGSWLTHSHARQHTPPHFMCTRLGALAVYGTSDYFDCVWQIIFERDDTAERLRVAEGCVVDMQHDSVENQRLLSLTQGKCEMISQQARAPSLRVVGNSVWHSLV